MSYINLVPIDIVFIAVILFFTIRCIIKGFVTEFLSMAAVIAGITAGVFFSGTVSSYIDIYIGKSGWNYLIAFLILFIICYLIIKIIEKMLYRFVERVELEHLDRALGLFLGIFEGGVLVLVIIMLLKLQPLFPYERIAENSIAFSIAEKILIYLPKL